MVGRFADGPSPDPRGGPRRVLKFAEEETLLFGDDFLGTEHLLLGLILEGESVAAKALASLGISLEAVRHELAVRHQEVEVIGPADGPTSGSPPLTSRAKKVLELSLREALELGNDYIGPEHLLLGLVHEGEGVAAQVLVNLGADLARLRRLVVQLLTGYPAADHY